MDQILFECLSLGLDAILLGFCYSFYRKKSRNAKAVQDAPCVEINSDLYKHLQSNSDGVPYAVVCGIVKASSNHLQSQYLPNIKGVIREKITKERKVRWSPFMRIWSTVDQDIQKSNNAVPFALVGSGRWFKSRVDIVDPLHAEELTLTTVYDHFMSHEDTISEMVAGWFRGERTTGVQEIESMLTEGTVLTGVGELVLEDGSLKLRPPSTKATFFLTPMSVEALIKKLRDDEKFFKTLSYFLGFIGVVIIARLLAKYYQSRKLKRETARLRDISREASRLRRIANPSRNMPSEDSRIPLCVICLTNPVEVIILECGHTCLCFDCSEHIRVNCPVCRSEIDRVIPAYLP